MFENCFSSHTFFSPVFAFIIAFNGDISKWETGAVTNMAGSKLFGCFENCFFSHTFFFPAFYGASAFNGDISKWETGAVTDMSWSKL